MAQIHEAIIAIMGEIGAIGKNQTNQQQHFKYRGIDDVMNALNPLLIKHGVFLVPEVLEKAREERESKSGGNLIYSVLTVKYTFYAADGSSVTAIIVGEGMDSGDKASNKALAIAMKYAMFQVFCIPTEEMKDPDADTPPPSTPKFQTTDVNTIDPRAAAINAYTRKHKLSNREFKEALAEYTTLPLAEVALEDLKRYIAEMERQ